MNKNKLLKLSKKYHKIEKEIFNEIDKGENKCNCETLGKDSIKIIHEGDSFDEIIKYCLNCGGIIV